MPSGVVLLLGSGQVISLKLIIDPKLLRNTSSNTSNSNSTDNSTKASNENVALETDINFIEHIKNILKRNVTQPILSLDKNAEPSPDECFELLTQAQEVLRTQYLERHKTVREEFRKREKSIMLRKEQLQKDLECLEKERELIREQAHKLAERFEEISEQQEVQVKR